MRQNGSSECVWGMECRYAVVGRCRYTHTEQMEVHFGRKRELAKAEARWRREQGCAHHRLGRCRYGDACRWGHGDSDYDSSDGERQGTRVRRSRCSSARRQCSGSGSGQESDEGAWRPPRPLARYPEPRPVERGWVREPEWREGSDEGWETVGSEERSALEEAIMGLEGGGSAGVVEGVDEVFVAAKQVAAGGAGTGGSGEVVRPKTEAGNFGVEGWEENHDSDFLLDNGEAVERGDGGEGGVWVGVLQWWEDGWEGVEWEGVKLPVAGRGPAGCCAGSPSLQMRKRQRKKARKRWEGSRGRIWCWDSGRAEGCRVSGVGGCWVEPGMVFWLRVRVWVWRLQIVLRRYMYRGMVEQVLGERSMEAGRGK